MNPRFSFGASAVPQQVAQAPAAPAAPQAGAPNFLMDLLGQFFAAQAANVPRAQQFQEDRTFGRHLGMDGQPVGQGLSFNELRRTPEQRIASERSTFGGLSYTAGDRVMPTAQAMAATAPVVGQANDGYVSGPIPWQMFAANPAMRASGSFTPGLYTDDEGYRMPATGLPPQQQRRRMF